MDHSDLTHTSVLYLLYFRTLSSIVSVVQCSSNFGVMSTTEMRGNDCMYTGGMSVLIGKLCLIDAINFVYICECFHKHACSLLYSIVHT